ncbi:hypothetical protein AV530_011949 [Patagioenas fasciata monilis]|uniref:Uncharacterized protein n=1 Tax=Patagioenas fasciata monilis TaxID=372326 RepID=A0A1V4JUE1_PATFA|nr:hypothetical protein AV530_011949 [Patagioenas fasciata monilis]
MMSLSERGMGLFRYEGGCSMRSFGFSYGLKQGEDKNLRRAVVLMNYHFQTDQFSENFQPALSLGLQNNSSTKGIDLKASTGCNPGSPILLVTTTSVLGTSFTASTSGGRIKMRRII